MSHSVDVGFYQLSLTTGSPDVTQCRCGPLFTKYHCQISGCHTVQIWTSVHFSITSRSRDVTQCRCGPLFIKQYYQIAGCHTVKMWTSSYEALQPDRRMSHSTDLNLYSISLTTRSRDVTLWRCGLLFTKPYYQISRCLEAARLGVKIE